MNKKLTTLSFFAAFLFAPLCAFAITLPTPITGDNVPLTIMNNILNLIWPLFVGFSVLMFLIAGFNLLAANGDEGKIKTARMAIVWGIVGVVVGILAFSIPFVIQNEILTPSSSGFIPPTTGSSTTQGQVNGYGSQLAPAGGAGSQFSPTAPSSTSTSP